LKADTESIVILLRDIEVVRQQRQYGAMDNTISQAEGEMLTDIEVLSTYVDSHSSTEVELISDPVEAS